MRSYAVLVAIAIILATVVAGCGKHRRPSAGDNKLIDTLSTAVDDSRQGNFTATYLYGAKPHRVVHTQAGTTPAFAFVFDTGRYVSTTEYAMSCVVEHDHECTLVDALTTPAVPTETFSEIGLTGFITARPVIGWLTEASSSSTATITTRSTTIAGKHSTCLDVAGADTTTVPDFTACITDTGILGHFEGTVNGRALSIQLASISNNIDQGQFEIPEDAAVTDNRSQ